MFAGGCVSTHESTSNTLSTSDASGELAKSEPGEVSETDSDEVQQIEEATIEEGFCKDDVYATYLREQFIAESTASKRRSPQVLSKSEQRRLELEALFHARSRLVGPMNEFYGTLPVVANPRVEYWIKYFKTNGRQQFLKWLVRAESVKEIVHPLLQQEGLPEEIFFLGMIESGFSNTAYSKARATGPWQFMKATAQIYGLKLNHWVDERRDPVKSTIAAARYLKDMYVKFGDWYLAMASYNAGPGKISRAIRKTGSRDFWKISQTNYLKAETKHYVPKVLAAAILASNPQAHGFDVTPDPQDRPPNGQVFLTRPLKLDDLATKLQVPSKQITKWNPELLRDITPPINIARGESYPLRLPIELLERFNEVSTEIAYLEVEDVTLHKIKPGETLTSIAKKYGAPAQHIKSVNPDLNVRALKIGRQVAIPVPNVRSH